MLVRRLTATSKEWREINKETKQLSISREREMRTPGYAQHIKLKEYNSSRNNFFRPSIGGNQGLNQIDVKYSYPIYALSTRNMVIKNFRYLMIILNLHFHKESQTWIMHYILIFYRFYLQN